MIISDFLPILGASPEFVHRFTSLKRNDIASVTYGQGKYKFIGVRLAL